MTATPGVPTQLAALVGIVLAWLNPTHALPSGGAQSTIVAALSLLVGLVHAVQAYHRRTVATANTQVSSSAPPAAPRVG